MPTNKKVNQSLWCVVFIGLCLLTACKSIIEEDISDKKVIIDTPTASSTTSYTQLFWWEKVDGALTYQVQIAKPSFANVQKLLLDTSITGTKINYTLSAGGYEWRVRAVNGSYQSPYSGSLFTIQDVDISTLRVKLKSPDTGKSTKSTTLTWEPVPNDSVNSYRLQVSKSSAFTPTIQDVSTTATSYDAAISDETTYYWRVKAYTDTDSSQWSIVSSFIYDVTPPDIVTLTSPANSTSVLVPTKGTLNWVNVETGAKYYLYIIYGTDAEKVITVTTNSYNYSADINQTVKWRVKAFDAAGNTSTDFSPTWSFKTGTAAARTIE